MNKIGEMEASLWNESDGFYYDVLHLHERQITFITWAMISRWNVLPALVR